VIPGAIDRDVPVVGELYGRGDHGARMLGAQASPQRLTAPVGGVAALEVVCTRTDAPLHWRSMYIQLVHRPLHPKCAHDHIGSGKGSIASAHPRNRYCDGGVQRSEACDPFGGGPNATNQCHPISEQQPEGERLRLYRDEPCTILVLPTPRARFNGELFARAAARSRRSARTIRQGRK
jgi:hypothetical protein